MQRTRRWTLIVSISGALTVATALAAALTTDDQQPLTFVVFALTTFPLFLGAVWAFVPNPNDPTEPANPQDTVERSWIQRAGFGAFTDLLTAMGLALAAKYVLGAPDVALLVFLVLGFADVGVRYLVLRQREG